MMATEVFQPGLERALPLSRRLRDAFLWRLVRKRIAVVALAAIIVIYGAGILAPWVAPYGYNEQNLNKVRQGPSREHLLGTDFIGRDMLSRIMWSAQTTVIVTAATLFTGGIVIGVTLGLLSGYLGGRVDTIVMRLGDLFFALPGLLMLIMITATVRPRVTELAHDFEDWSGIGGIVSSGLPDYFLVFGALSLFGWVGIARIIRSQILALRETDYVVAARAMGASVWRIIGLHLLPNVTNLIIVGLSASLAGIAGSEIALSWLGVGVRPPHPSFGALIFDASSARVLQAYPHMLLGPAVTVAVLIFSFNLLGDALNDLLNPRRR